MLGISCFMHGDLFTLMKMKRQLMSMYRVSGRWLPCSTMVNHKFWKCLKTLCPHPHIYNCVLFPIKIPGQALGTARRILTMKKLKDN